MFSPGGLNAQTGVLLGGVSSHAETGSNCAACHAMPFSPQTMADRCVTCHMNIQAELSNAATLHGALSKNKPITCRNCHPEHRGADAALTVMDSVSFPHEVTGFALTGHNVHADNTPFACSDCHTERISTFTQQTCYDCHRSLDPDYSDSHRQAFGDDCLACHDGQDRYGDFDHSQVKFALTGSHLQVPCSQCHISTRTIAALQNTPTTCESCHQADDAHNGQFGTQCDTVLVNREGNGARQILNNPDGCVVSVIVGIVDSIYLADQA